MAKVKDEVTPDDLIAQAMSQATISSGAANLPPAGEVPTAFARGEVIASQIAMPVESSLAGGMQAVLAENPYCPADVKAVAEATAKALAMQAPPAPPVQIGIGNTTALIPASVRTYPYKLHKENAPKAMALWNVFVGPDKATMARLAAQSGFMSTPFLYLAQNLIQLIEIDGFFPVADPNGRKFDPLEKDPGGSFYQGLVEWAGPELARSIARLCEQAGVSVLTGLHQMYLRLAEKQAQHLKKVQTTETIAQWSE